MTNFNYNSFLDKDSRVDFYIRYQFSRTQAMFEYKNLPNGLSKKKMEKCLQQFGYCGIIKYNDVFYSFNGGWHGLDPYGEPTHFIVNNPILNLNKTYKIDEECVIISNDSYKLGLLPMFSRYAAAMSENDISMNVHNINSRIMSIITADTDNEKKAADKFISDIKNGELGAIATNTFTQGIKTQPYANSNAVKITDLIEYQQYLKASWYNEIGLNSNYNMKRETLNSAELATNEECLLPFVDDMLTNRKKGIEKVNQIFDTQIEVELNSAWKNSERSEKGGIEDVNNK